MKYEDELEKATLYKFPIESLIKVCEETYAPLSSKMRRKVFYEAPFYLLSVFKAVDEKQDKKFIETHMEALKEGDYSGYQCHYILLRDLMYKDLIPEGLYVIIP